MRRLLVLMLLLAACTPPNQPPGTGGFDGSVDIYHDDQRSVTCWVFDNYNGGGISCLPDEEVGGP